MEEFAPHRPAIIPRPGDVLAQAGAAAGITREKVAMRLVSVNVSLPKLVEFRGRTVSTSIFKQPAGGRLLVRRLSLEGDWQADLRAHGGLNKAVYAYPLEHYAWWSQETGRADFR